MACHWRNLVFVAENSDAEQLPPYLAPLRLLWVTEACAG